MAENKIEKHIKDIAIMLADMAYFIPAEVFKYIAKKNKEQFSEFEELLKGRIEISHYLFKGSACVFPGVIRRSSGIPAERGWKLNYHQEAKAILDDNITPRHIWCFLYLGESYAPSIYANSELSQFEVAHLFPHKQRNLSFRLVNEVFGEINNDINAFSCNFTGAGNTVLLPKGSTRPTDGCPEIMLVFFRRCLQIYGEKCLGGAKKFEYGKVPSWYDDLKWNSMELPTDWKARIDSLIQYRTKFLYEKLHKEFGDLVKKPLSLQSDKDRMSVPIIQSRTISKTRVMERSVQSRSFRRPSESSALVQSVKTQILGQLMSIKLPPNWGLRHAWTDEDEVIALDAYLSTLDKRMMLRDNAIAKGVRLINRRSERDGVSSLMSIGMKIQNIQYLDTNGREGLSGYSQRNERIFNEYRNAPDKLKKRMAEIIATLPKE